MISTPLTQGSTRGAKLRIALLHLGALPRGGHPRHHLAPVDFGILAAQLEAEGHAVSFADSAVDGGAKACLRALRATAPQLLVLRVAMHALDELAVVEASRLAAPVIAVGPVATTLPRLLARSLSSLVAVVRGEAEAVLPGLLQMWDTTSAPPKVPGLLSRAEALDFDDAPGSEGRSVAYVSDLDALPTAAPTLFLARPYRFGYPMKTSRKLRIGYLLSARGCPHRCSFCSPVERASIGKGFRPRDPVQVAAEALALQRNGATGIYFLDDLVSVTRGVSGSGAGEDRHRALAEAFLGAGVSIPWALQARVGGIDRETAKVLARAGCSTVCVGVESGDDGILKRLDKGTRAEEAEEQFAFFREAGLLSVAFLIVAAPGEDEAALERTRELVRAIRPDLLQVHLFTRYPGSRETAVDSGHGTVYGADSYETKFWHPDQAQGGRDPRQAQGQLYRDFYLNPRTWARIAGHSAPFYLANLPNTLSLGLALLRRIR